MNGTFYQPRSTRIPPAYLRLNLPSKPSAFIMTCSKFLWLTTNGSLLGASSNTLGVLAAHTSMVYLLARKRYFLSCVCNSTRCLRLSIYNQIVDVVDLHYQGQTFGISMFCYNSKTADSRTIIFGIYVHVVEEANLTKFQRNCTHVLDLHLRSNFRNFILFAVSDLVV